MAIYYVIDVCADTVEQVCASEAFYELRPDTGALETSLLELTRFRRKSQQRKLCAMAEGRAFLDIVHHEDALKLDTTHNLNAIDLLSLSAMVTYYNDVLDVETSLR